MDFVLKFFTFFITACFLSGCFTAGKISSSCRDRCSNIPMSSFSEKEACEKKCMDPSAMPEVREKSGEDGGIF